MSDLRFTLSIDLGNDAMQTAADVADALRNIAENVAFSDFTGGPIRDAYGNTVGSWQVTEDDADSPLGDPPAELADAWRRFQAGEDVEPWELRDLDEWRGERAADAGY